MSSLSKGRELVEALKVYRSGKAETEHEKGILRAFPGFGSLALQVFPDPATGAIKKGWDGIAAEVRELLTDAEYASARRTVFNAFYTSPVVMNAIFAGFKRLGVPDDARVLEPGCGVGGFIGSAPVGMQITGVEMDVVTGGMARLAYPDQDIRIENFRDTRLPPGSLDAVVGNVPFADITLDYHGDKLSLHDFFIAKSLDLLAPGGVMGIVTSRYTMDKLDSAARELFQSRADLLAAIRLPNEAFKEQGTSVTTDILFFRKRHSEEAEMAFDWEGVAETPEGRVNAYFAARPEMVLGTPALGHGQYGQETYSVAAGSHFHADLAMAIYGLQPGIWNARPTGPAKTVKTAPAGHGEGSFYIEDGAIYQVECGAAEPVMYGETHLHVDGGLTGRRLAALIAIRDDARAVLRAQNEGLDPDERERTRKALNRSYDRFKATYGAINKTTFSTKERDGETVTTRRQPNLVKFREDPDAVLVMSLEVYDEAHDEAEKAPIMLRDVVGPARTVTSVTTAEEGLLVSLNERGRVDLNHIAALYGKPVSVVIEELDDRLFHDPETDQYQTRELYLSGNVRQRLAAARASTDTRHRRNVAALEAIQPEDLGPGDIDANLGAPWIPARYVRDFAVQLLEVGPDSVTVDHFAKDALWSVDGDSKVSGSAQNLSEFGTERADALTLLGLSLNMKSPQIYDIIRTPEGESRVLNQEQTFAAKEKQRIIKERWAAFVFADQDRAEHLVRIYNDTFNNLVLPEFDGSHLTFPGMAETFIPRQHQRDVTWRVMSGGNTLMAHAVGAGKTASAAMAAMKLKQTGLVRKSLIAIPNHMLEQFSREFLQIYPNARLLIAGKEDLARDRRRLLTAKIATGEWDAIIVTHSSFERIGMSKAYQEQFLGREIDSYARLLIEAKGTDVGRNVLKHIEKRKAAYEEKLKELLADRKKDDGLVFDELGVDQILIDESHYFKNLEIATKMDRVAGIQTGGSQRAFDLFMKCQYLDGRTPGRGISFQTGTPISNSMVEMYTVMRYLAPRLLLERGIEHFDAWAAAFGNVVESMEISPDGATLRARARFAQFVNLPEVQSIFRSFSDVRTADMLKLPVPRLKTGKAQIVSCPMSPEQRETQAALVERYESIRRGGVSPREDNALAITTDGRKLALDLRLLADGEGYEDSKVNALIENVHRIWQETAVRRATQMIFSDIGVNPTEWGFSVYGEIIEALVRRGVPRAEIANIGDANTDAKKAALFAAMRAGRVRILLGSTSKMGTGTNVQKLLYAVHHLDAPWKPAEIEQRDGRILRQGNDNAEVEIYRYVTEGSFDAYMWQALENKARFIAQIMKGGVGLRRADDIGGAELSFAEVKAIASGNPAVLTLAEMDADLQRLTLLRRSHADEQFRIRSAVRDLPERIDWLERRAAQLAADHTMAMADRSITVGSAQLGREDAIEAMNEKLKNLIARTMKTEQVFPVGTYHGFKLSLRTQGEFMPELIVEGRTRTDIDFRGIAAGRLLNQIDGIVEGMPEKARKMREERATKEAQLEGFKARVGLEFERGGELAVLQGWRDELEKLLTTGEDRERMDALCAEYQAAKGKVAVEVAAEPVEVQEAFAVAAAPAQVAQAEPVEAAALPATLKPETNVLTPAFAEAVKEQQPEPVKPPPVYEKPATTKRAARRSAPDQLMFRF